MELSREPKPFVRILVSERDEWFCDLVAALVHDIARLGISLATIVPATVREDDLLELASKQHFDLAVLFLNNILYSSGDRGRLEDDSLALVRKMILLFHKPVIAFYGWPDSALYGSRTLDAGATAAFHLPCNIEDIK